MWFNSRGAEKAANFHLNFICVIGVKPPNSICKVVKMGGEGGRKKVVNQKCELNVVWDETRQSSLASFVGVSAANIRMPPFVQCVDVCLAACNCFCFPIPGVLRTIMRLLMAAASPVSGRHSAHPLENFGLRTDAVLLIK